MKTIHITLLIAAICMLCGCQEDNSDNLYKGGSFVQFADSAYNMPVTQDEPVFEVPVVFSSAVQYDRKVIVDVDPRHSNAIEGYHYSLVSRNLTIPAGEMKVNVQLKGHYAHLQPSDSLAVTLRIIGLEDQANELYGLTTNVQLIKVLPFDIHDYVGDLLLTCTFPYSTSSTTDFALKSEYVNDSTLLVRDVFETGRDMKLYFHTGKDNPFDRDIELRETVAFTDDNYGPVSMATVPNAPSYYIPENRAFVLYLNAYLAQVGSFGSYYYIFQWMTPDEATAFKNGLTTLH